MAQKWVVLLVTNHEGIDTQAKVILCDLEAHTPSEPYQHAYHLVPFSILVLVLFHSHGTQTHYQRSLFIKLSIAFIANTVLPHGIA